MQGVFFDRTDHFFVTNLWPWGKKTCDEDLSLAQRDYYDFKENLSLSDITNSLTDIKNSIYKERFSYLQAFFEKYNWREKYIFFAVCSSDKFYMNVFVSLLMNDRTIVFKNLGSDKVHMIKGFPKMFNTYHAASRHPNYQLDDEAIEFIKSKL